MAGPLNQKTIQDPPFATPFIEQTGFVSRPWSIWIRQAFYRMGGNDAPTNTEIDTVKATATAQAATIVVIQSNISSLQSATGGLGVGPVL